MPGTKKWKATWGHLEAIVGSLSVADRLRLYGRLLKYPLPSTAWDHRDDLGLGSDARSSTPLGQVMAEFMATTTATVLSNTAINQKLRNIVGVVPSGGNPALRKRRIEKLRSIFKQGLAGNPGPSDALEQAIDRAASAVIDNLLT